MRVIFSAILNAMALGFQGVTALEAFLLLQAVNIATALSAIIVS